MRIANHWFAWHALAVCMMPLTLLTAQEASANNAQSRVDSAGRIASVVIVDTRRQRVAAVQTAESSQALLNFSRRQVTPGTFNCGDAVTLRDSLAKPPRPGATPPKLPELRQLMALIDCATDTLPVAARSAAAELVAKTARANEDKASLRVESLKSDKIRIVVVQTATAIAIQGGPTIVRGAQPNIKFTEVARRSQISTDFETLGQLVSKVFLVGAIDAESAKDTPVTWLMRTDQPLTLRRAKLSLEISNGSGTKVLWADIPEPEKVLEEIDAYRAAQKQLKALEQQQKQEEAARPLAEQRYLKQLAADSALELRLSRYEDSRKYDCSTWSPVSRLACQLLDAEAAPEIRLASARGLGESGSRTAVKALQTIAGTSSEPETLRMAATQALGKLRVLLPPLALAAPPAASSAQSVQPAQTSPAAGSPPQAAKADLLTGPNEHWFLTADVPVTSAETFAFDEDTDQLDLVDEPSRFYVGVGFLLGDLASENRSFVGNIVLKGMVTLSRKPLDSYGFAVGLRGSFLRPLGVDFETLTPFIGYTRTLEDAVDTNGQVLEKARRNSQFRFGVSLNLDRATSWMEK